MWAKTRPKASLSADRGLVPELTYRITVVAVTTHARPAAALLRCAHTRYLPEIDLQPRQAGDILEVELIRFGD